MVRAYPDIGERVPVIGCHSEVMMHFRLAAMPIEIELVYSLNLCGDIAEPRYVMGQVWVDGRKYSFPVTTGEAGFYGCGEPLYRYYCYADASRLPAQPIRVATLEEEACLLQTGT